MMLSTRRVLQALLLSSGVCAAESGAADEPSLAPPPPNTPSPPNTPLPPEAVDQYGTPKRQIPAQPGPLPPQYELGTTGISSVWGTGVGLLVGGYALSAIVGGLGAASDGICLDDSSGDSLPWAWGFIPLAGPFVVTAIDDFKSYRIFSTVFGVAQHAGLAMIIGGATAKREVWNLKTPAPKSFKASVHFGPAWLRVTGEF